jgi:hypothetical protein
MYFELVLPTFQSSFAINCLAKHPTQDQPHAEHCMSFVIWQFPDSMNSFHWEAIALAIPPKVFDAVFASCATPWLPFPPRDSAPVFDGIQG